MFTKKDEILEAHKAISNLSLPARYRVAMHRTLGEAVEFDRPWWAGYGWGERENCLSLKGQIEDVRLVYGLFHTENVQTETILICLWQSRIPDSATEWVEKDGDAYYYHRSSLQNKYFLDARIIAHRNGWIVLDASQQSPENTEYVFGADDYGADDMGGHYDFLPEFGEIDFSQFPPEHYWRPYWDARFRAIPDEEIGNFVQVRTPDEMTEAQFEDCVKAVIDAGAEIVGVLREPGYVWQGRIYVPALPETPIAFPVTCSVTELTIVDDHDVDDHDVDDLGSVTLKMLRERSELHFDD